MALDRSSAYIFLQNLHYFPCFKAKMAKKKGHKNAQKTQFLKNGFFWKILGWVWEDQSLTKFEKMLKTREMLKMLKIWQRVLKKCA